MIQAIISAFLIVICVSPAQSLTLEDAVSLAFSRNHGLKEKHLETGVAREEIKQSRSVFFPSLDGSYLYGHSNREDELQNKSNSSAALVASWNIFNGFSDINRFKASEDRSRAVSYVEASYREELRLTVSNAYIDYLLARKIADVSRDAISRLESQLKDTRLGYRVGVYAKNQVLKVEAETAASRRDLLKAEGDVRTAKKSLAQLMETDPEGIDELTDLSLPLLKSYDLGELEKRMYSSRSELKYLALLEEASQRETEAIRGEALPQLFLETRLSSYGDSADPYGRDGAFDDDFRVSLEARWNLFDGMNRSSRIRASRIQSKILKERALQLRSNMKTTLMRALESYDVARESYFSSEKEVASAEENYQVTLNMLQNQTTTTTELLDARTILTRARTGYAQAVYDIHRARFDLRRITESPIAQADSKKAARI